ncbi:MAG: hypothetical protein Q4F72_12175 [Desulfovibrionaceae bacterium]|nr:hypothetical protein [Desulfovibrionaceae bacterium]
MAVLSVLLLMLVLALSGGRAMATTVGLDSADLSGVTADRVGTTIEGYAHSVGPGLATAANQAAGIDQLAQVGKTLCEQLAVLNTALQTRLAGSSSAGNEMALGATREMVAALERLAGTLSADIEATQHNPLNDKAPCTDMAAALGGSGQQKTRESLDELQEETLDETRRDGVVRNFAQAQGQQDYVLLDSDLLKDEKVFRPGWILPATGLITEQARSTYMIGVLANPTPAPKVSDEAALTPGGRKGAAALKIKSAQTGVAEGALRFVSQFFLPLANYSAAVPEMEEEAGVDEADRKEADEMGYSLMQYFSARQQYFSGNLNRIRESALWNSNDTLKQLMIVLSESYHLQLEALRASLYQTALLATLVGIQSRDQNEVVERHLAPLRQAAAAE